MNKIKWGWKIGVKLTIILILLFVLGGTVAWSSSGAERLKALYTDVKIYIGGKPVAWDIKPFLLAEKGVIMVPLRSLGEALEKEVNWDARTNSIFISERSSYGGNGRGEEPGAAWLETMPVLRNVGPFYRQEGNLMIAGRPFGHALAVELPARGSAEAVVELAGKYELLSGYFGVEDNTSESSGGYVLTIYADEKQVYRSDVVKPGNFPKYLEVAVEGARRLTIRTDWEETGIGDFEEVTVALAKFRLK